MSSLLLHLHGPLQSWGGPARFSQRPTGTTPTKSAIVGLLAAASGRPRGSDISDISELVMTVRADRPGRLLRDYHTVGADYPKGRRLRNAEGKERSDALVTERYYLADAAFTVALTGDDAFVASLDQSLRNPRWSLALGRRSCPPAEPFHLGTIDADPTHLLENVLPVARRDTRHDRVVRFSADDPSGERTAVPDHPDRELNRWDNYRPRPVRSWALEMDAARFVDQSFALLDQLEAM